jgi:hypothetical protein
MNKELVEAVVRVLKAHPGGRLVDVLSQVSAERGAAQTMHAAHMVALAYCRLMVKGSGVRFEETYKHCDENTGDWRRCSLAEDELFGEATECASVGGLTGDEVLAIASRSPEFQAINQLLMKGVALANIQLTEPLLTW